MQILEEENARLVQTIDDMKNQSSISHSSPNISPDSNNATRKLQDEINTLTKRNCGKVISLNYRNSSLCVCMCVS